MRSTRIRGKFSKHGGRPKRKSTRRLYGGEGTPPQARSQKRHILESIEAHKAHAAHHNDQIKLHKKELKGLREFFFNYYIKYIKSSHMYLPVKK